jgi:hypothetical protein
MKANSYNIIYIDSSNKTVSVRKCSTLRDLYILVGGYIQKVHHFKETNDYLYVNQEGLLASPKYFFNYSGVVQPFAGNGLIVGKTNNSKTSNHGILLSRVISNVEFLGKEEVLQMISNNIEKLCA